MLVICQAADGTDVYHMPFFGLAATIWTHAETGGSQNDKTGDMKDGEKMTS